MNNFKIDNNEINKYKLSSELDYILENTSDLFFNEVDTIEVVTNEVDTSEVVTNEVVTNEVVTNEVVVTSDEIIPILFHSWDPPSLTGISLSLKSNDLTGFATRDVPSGSCSRADLPVWTRTRPALPSEPIADEDKSVEQIRGGGAQVPPPVGSLRNLENIPPLEIPLNTPIALLNSIEHGIKYDTIVLSGGGPKGLLLLGGLHYLKENGCIDDIKFYIGTSIGAIIGYLLAIGYTPLEIVVYLCSHKVDIINFNFVSMINGGGACSFTNIQEQIELMTIDKIGSFVTMKDLYTRYNKTLICCTYNITKNIVEYISYENYPDMPCITALRMSSNLPFVFDKYKYLGNFYIDGVVCDNFPIDIGDKVGKKVIGLLLDQQSLFSDYTTSNIIEYFFKTLFIPMVQVLENKIKNLSSKCKIISINHDIGMFNFDIATDKKLELFSSGYNQVKNMFKNN